MAVEKRERLLTQLSSIKYIDKHLKERRRRYPGTGAWLAETIEFREWINEDRFVCLWCYGIREYSGTRSIEQFYSARLKSKRF
jgi:hypothetical protein